MKKRHLLTKPTRNGDINFEDFEDVLDSKTSARAERIRVRSYRKIRHQEA